MPVLYFWVFVQHVMVFFIPPELPNAQNITSTERFDTHCRSLNQTFVTYAKYVENAHRSTRQKLSWLPFL